MKTTFEPSTLLWWTSSSGTIEFQMPWEAVQACSHSGDCDSDVAYWAPRIAEMRLSTVDPIRRFTPEDVRKELREYGAWDDKELANDAANWRRIIWLAANDINENPEGALS